MLRLLPLLMIFWLPNLTANVDAYTFESDEQLQLYRTMVAELRCLVCQNQNLADSNAELAQDLRRKTYEMVSAGSGKQAIVDYMVARYGDFVLYRPPLKGTTLLLWIGPGLLLFGSLIGFGLMLKRRKRVVDDGLSEDQRQEAAQLLEGVDEMGGNLNTDDRGAG